MALWVSTTQGPIYAGSTAASVVWHTHLHPHGIHLEWPRAPWLLERQEAASPAVMATGGRRWEQGEEQLSAELKASLAQELQSVIVHRNLVIDNRIQDHTIPSCPGGISSVFFFWQPHLSRADGHHF